MTITRTTQTAGGKPFDASVSATALSRVSIGGADAVVFSGGIGENIPAVRARICEGMAWCGLEIDPEANRRAVGVEGEIGLRGARMRVLVIPSDEEAVIARETAACLLQVASHTRVRHSARL